MIKPTPAQSQGHSGREFDDRWVDQWHAWDFSWNALADANWGSGADPDSDFKCWRAPIDFPGQGPIVGQGPAAYRQSNLQEYWRWSLGFPGAESTSDTSPAGRLLSDDALLEAGLLVEMDGQLWHRVHRPETRLADVRRYSGDHVETLWAMVFARLDVQGSQAAGGDNRLQLNGLRARGIDRVLQSYRDQIGGDAAWRLGLRAEAAEFDNVDFEAVRFAKGTCFQQSRFIGAADFRDCEFQEGSNWDRATFSGGADFYKAAFGDETSFKRVRFGGETLFQHSEFGRAPDFSHSQFHASADFRFAAFGPRADFRGTKFHAPAGFHEAQFGENASFRRTSFGPAARFNRATLAKAQFHEAVFGDLADLSLADMSHAQLRSIDLRRTTVVWRGARLDDAEFTNVNYERSALRGRCTGLKGAATIWGDSLLRRDFQDQDYIDTLDAHLTNDRPNFISKPKGGETVGARVSRHLRNARALLNPQAGSRVWLGIAIGAIGGSVLAALVVDPGLFGRIGQTDGLSNPSDIWSAINSGGQPGLLALAALILIPSLTILLNGWVGRRIMFRLWALLGYGRDWDRVAVFAVGLIAVFGGLYALAQGDHVVFGCDIWDHTACETGETHWFTPWFVAAMGFTTLGVSDVAQPVSGLGQLLMIANVLSGFTIFGLLLAVLGNRFARRS